MPGLDADPEFELPRISAPRLERWIPLFEPLFELVFELPFPGRETSRLFPVDLLSCRLAFEICDCPRSEDNEDERVAAAVVPRAEKKC